MADLSALIPDLEEADRLAQDRIKSWRLHLKWCEDLDLTPPAKGADAQLAEAYLFLRQQTSQADAALAESFAEAVLAAGFTRQRVWKREELRKALAGTERVINTGAVVDALAKIGAVKVEE